MEKFKIVDIKIPKQPGCEHIEVDVEYEDSGRIETISYHMSDVRDHKEDEQDEVIKILRETAKNEKVKTREQLKESITKKDGK